MFKQFWIYAGPTNAQGCLNLVILKWNEDLAVAVHAQHQCLPTPQLTFDGLYSASSPTVETIHRYIVVLIHDESWKQVFSHHLYLVLTSKLSQLHPKCQTLWQKRQLLDWCRKLIQSRNIKGNPHTKCYECLRNYCVINILKLFSRIINQTPWQPLISQGCKSYTFHIQFVLLFQYRSKERSYLKIETYWNIWNQWKVLWSC